MKSWPGLACVVLLSMGWALPARAQSVDGPYGLDPASYGPWLDRLGPAAGFGLETVTSAFGGHDRGGSIRIAACGGAAGGATEKGRADGDEGKSLGTDRSGRPGSLFTADGVARLGRRSRRDPVLAGLALPGFWQRTWARALRQRGLRYHV